MFKILLLEYIIRLGNYNIIYWMLVWKYNDQKQANAIIVTYRMVDQFTKSIKLQYYNKLIF